MEIFKRNISGTTEILQNKIVGIAGCGGLGSNIAVSLVRAGIGKLILVDFDTVEASNLNRQYFFQADIGEKKVDALAKHLTNINPKLELEIYDKKLSSDRVEVLFSKADLLIEAFDRAESKKWLIETWAFLYKDKFVVSGNGLSGMGDFDSLKIRKMGNIYFCGDGQSDMSEGLLSARVTIVANMQAEVAIKLLCGKLVK